MPGPAGCTASTRRSTGSAAARAAAPAGTFVLNARTDTYFGGVAGDPFDETVERATRYVEAGADCIFVPGVVEEDTIRRLAAAIPAPLNVVAGLASVIDAPTLFALGVRRVSLGGGLARASLGLLERAGRELLDAGTLGSSTARSGTPNCSDASAPDPAHGRPGPERPGVRGPGTGRCSWWAARLGSGRDWRGWNRPPGSGWNVVTVHRPPRCPGQPAAQRPDPELT